MTGRQEPILFWTRIYRKRSYIHVGEYPASVTRLTTLGKGACLAMSGRISKNHIERETREIWETEGGVVGGMYRGW